MTTMGGNFTPGIGCPKCGGWIAAGSSHQCVKARVEVTVQPTVRSFEERTALALERIATVLEAIIAAPPPPAPVSAPELAALDVEKTRATFAPKPPPLPDADAEDRSVRGRTI